MGMLLLLRFFFLKIMEIPFGLVCVTTEIKIRKKKNKTNKGVERIETS